MVTLNDEEDGIYIIKPPSFLIEFGLEEPDIYWKLKKAMHGLRKAPHKWEQHMKQQRKLYEEWDNELIIKPILRPNKEEAKKTDLGIEYGKVQEHPLNNEEKSDWNRYFNDQELWTEIEKDVRRTRTDLNFFTNAFDPANRKYKE